MDSSNFTPENRAPNTKNPDAIIDGKIGEMKTIISSKIDKIEDRLKEAVAQKAQIACIQSINTNEYAIQESINVIQGFLKKTKEPLEKVIYAYGNSVKTIKK